MISLSALAFHAYSLRRDKAADSTKLPLYLFLGAFALHLLYLSQYANSPFFWVPRMDSLYHDLLAQRIVAGTTDSTAFFRAPLYYHALAAVYALFGHSYWAARLIQSLIGSVSVVLLYVLSCRVAGKTVALLAAGLMATYAPLIFAQNELHTTVYEVFFTVLFLLLIVWAQQTLATRKGRGCTLAAIAGFVLGLAAITRPNALVALPILVWILLQNRDKETNGVPFCTARFAAFLCIAFALCAPFAVTLRNGIIAGDWVFIASQGGINLFLGNRAGADGFTPRTPTRFQFDTAYEDSVELYGQKAAEAALHKPLTAGQTQRYWINQTLHEWRERPVAEMQLLAKKWMLAWMAREIRNNTAFDYIRREWTPILWLAFAGFGLVAPLAIVGMVLSWKRTPFLRPLTLFVLLYQASFTLFFAADRFRLPVVPVLCLFAGYAILESYRIVQTEPFRNRFFLAAIALFAALFVWIPWYKTDSPQTDALDYWSAGNRLMAQKRFDDALPSLEKANQLDAENPEIWSSLGEAHYYRGAFDRAESNFARAILLDSTRASFYYNAALCAIGRADDTTARTLLNPLPDAG